MDGSFGRRDRPSWPFCPDLWAADQAYAYHGEGQLHLDRLCAQTRRGLCPVRAQRTRNGQPASPLEHFGIDSADTLAAFEHVDDPATIANILERRFRDLVEKLGRPHPSPISAAFEALSFINPKHCRICREMAISMRQLERIIRRDFGMPPKQVMRRARALDMASHLHGVADEAEAEELILRYFDQAQMTREFTELFGVTPRRFVKTPNPLLTLALESRQAKRLEALERVPPGGSRPWQ
jgi:AraC-like DNA-binding protein